MFPLCVENMLLLFYFGSSEKCIFTNLTSCQINVSGQTKYRTLQAYYDDVLLFRLNYKTVNENINATVKQYATSSNGL